MGYTGFSKVASKKDGLVFLCVDTIKNDNNVYIYADKGVAKRLYIGTEEVELSGQYKYKQIQVL